MMHPDPFSDPRPVWQPVASGQPGGFSAMPAPQSDTPPPPAAAAEISLADIHAELLASHSEGRRGNRRLLDVLKHLGGMLEAISAAALDTHKAVRALPTASAAPTATDDDSRLVLLDLADRLDRIRAGFGRAPDQAGGWWPGARRQAAAWREAWDRQAAAFSILHGHLASLIERAGLRRIETLGQSFDPRSMTAVEALVDPSKPDHTVVGELLAGWCCAASGQVVRPAQVKVSRQSSAL